MQDVYSLVQSNPFPGPKEQWETIWQQENWYVKGTKENIYDTKDHKAVETNDRYGINGMRSHPIWLLSLSILECPLCGQDDSKDLGPLCEQGTVTKTPCHQGARPLCLVLIPDQEDSSLSKPNVILSYCTLEIP